MDADLEGLNECEWLLETASESNGQIKYFVHGKVAVSVGGKQIKVQDENERSRWHANIKVLEHDGHIVLLEKRLGTLIFELT